MNVPSVSWKPDPISLAPSSAHVDIWRYRFDGISTHAASGGEGVAIGALPNLDEFTMLLSAAEHARANRFKIAAKQQEFIVGRGLTRRLLGRLLSTEPGALQFDEGPHGKPFLIQPPGSETLQFNLSHSHQWLLVAVTLGRAIGIDIEKQRAEVNIEVLARRFFSPREVQTLLQLAPELRPAAFFRCWSRKEAIVKAVGRGVSLGLSRFDVTLAPQDAPRLLDVRWEADSRTDWQLADLDVDHGYSAALAIDATSSKSASVDIRYWDSQA